MNDHHTGTVAGNAVDAENIRAFLQQAVDHYPRLAAFCFTLVLPYRETLSGYRTLILHFHTEVWQRTGEYSQARQQARHRSPPALLRWIWEAASAPECKMVLMLNLDTLRRTHDESAMQVISDILRESCLTVTGADCTGVTDITPAILNCPDRSAFRMRFSQLKATVEGMSLPVITARTGVIGP